MLDKYKLLKTPFLTQIYEVQFQGSFLCKHDEYPKK
jgi:hypothetical protein